MNKCVFLDRDGVINVDCVDYTYRVEDFKIIDGVIEGLQKLKKNGFLLIVITNQSGIIKGIYGHEDVAKCHRYFQEQCGGLIDAFFYSPYHQKYSQSLSRKPGSLMFEKAISKFDIDISSSWMVGDRERDLIPARKLELKTILLEDEVNKGESIYADVVLKNLLEASNYIIEKEKA